MMVCGGPVFGLVTCPWAYDFGAGNFTVCFFLLLVIVLSFLLMAPSWKTFIFAFVGDIFLLLFLLTPSWASLRKTGKRN